ncbi:MAG: dihydroorotase, partial [Dinoroseobacter sp.]|nr:dihydroorotase [Dinoroseobacter sp.]
MSLICFQNARLIDPQAGTEDPGSLLVQDGVIIAHNPSTVPNGAQTVDCEGKCLAPGIVDIGVKIGEPGERHKESFKTAGYAAAAGGVTTMVTRADTTPPVDTPEVLDFVKRRAQEVSLVRIAPMAALTKGREGREMTEFGFLRDAGAVAFSDGDRVVQDPKVLARALTYAKGLDALVFGHVQDPGLSKGAAV